MTALALLMAMSGFVTAGARGARTQHFGPIEISGCQTVNLNVANVGGRMTDVNAYFYDSVGQSLRSETLSLRPGATQTISWEAPCPSDPQSFRAKIRSSGKLSAGLEILGQQGEMIGQAPASCVGQGGRTHRGPTTIPSGGRAIVAVANVGSAPMEAFMNTYGTNAAHSQTVEPGHIATLNVDGGDQPSLTRAQVSVPGDQPFIASYQLVDATGRILSLWGCWTFIFPVDPEL